MLRTASRAGDRSGATAVLIDSTVVRMVLVPATMSLLGDANWWLPRWLDRALPVLDVEGAAPAWTEEEQATARAKELVP